MFKVEKKILLMGREKSGKTSMKSLIFDNNPHVAIEKLAPTVFIKVSSILFRNDTVLNIWDCGGKEEFSEYYFVTECDKVFRNAHILVFVFDVNNSFEEVKKDLNYFEECISLMFEYSPTAHVFCIINKMDKFNQNFLSTEKDVFIQYKEHMANVSKLIDCTFFKSSICDITVYQAWSEIVFKLLPKIQDYDLYLRSISENIGFEEALMFDHSTLLILASYERNNLNVGSKFQQILNSCIKFKEKRRHSKSNFTYIEWILNNKSCSKFPVMIKNFNSQTYVAIAMPDIKTLHERETLLKNKHFDCKLFFNTISNQEDSVSSSDQCNNYKT